MKKLSLLILVVLAAASISMAQTASGPGVTAGASGNIPYNNSETAAQNAAAGANSPPVYYSGDVLGAHLGYGRGCVMCHAPHGGAEGNGVTTADTTNGSTALWGENLANLYTKSVTFYTSSLAGTAYSVTLPGAPLTGVASSNSGVTTIILCLSCHDGVTAKGAMMTGNTVETLPIVGGNGVTLFANQPGNNAAALTYVNEHPVGPNAIVSCGGSGWGSLPAGAGSASWDCTAGQGGSGSTAIVASSGTAMSEFLTNYAASFWNTSSSPLAKFTGTVSAVSCTTCHNQHNMTVYQGKTANYTTMFFIKGYYNPYSGGNSTAQFCRNCHGMWSNEYYGLTNVPTT